MTLPDPLDRGLGVVPRGRPRELPRADAGGTVAEESGVLPRFRADWQAGLDEGDGAGACLPCVLAVAPIEDPLVCSCLSLKPTQPLGIGVVA